MADSSQVLSSLCSVDSVAYFRIASGEKQLLGTGELHALELPGKEETLLLNIEGVGSFALKKKKVPSLHSEEGLFVFPGGSRGECFALRFPADADKTQLSAFQQVLAERSLLLVPKAAVSTFRTNIVPFPRLHFWSVAGDRRDSADDWVIDEAKSSQSGKYQHPRFNELRVWHHTFYNELWKKEGETSIFAAHLAPFPMAQFFINELRTKDQGDQKQPQQQGEAQQGGGGEELPTSKKQRAARFLKKGAAKASKGLRKGEQALHKKLDEMGAKKVKVSAQEIADALQKAPNGPPPNVLDDLAYAALFLGSHLAAPAELSVARCAAKAPVEDLAFVAECALTSGLSDDSVAFARELAKRKMQAREALSAEENRQLSRALAARAARQSEQWRDMRAKAGPRAPYTALLAARLAHDAMASIALVIDLTALAAEKEDMRGQCVNYSLIGFLEACIHQAHEEESMFKARALQNLRRAWLLAQQHLEAADEARLRAAFKLAWFHKEEMHDPEAAKQVAKAAVDAVNAIPRKLQENLTVDAGVLVGDLQKLL